MISENASLTANANPSLATVPMSASGYKRTFSHTLIYVRFTPESGHTEAQCPLLGL